jgi:hypothetical protein
MAFFQFAELLKLNQIRESSPLRAGENACSTETTRLASSLQRKVARAFSPARILQIPRFACPVHRGTRALNI